MASGSGVKPTVEKYRRVNYAIDRSVRGKGLRNSECTPGHLCVSCSMIKIIADRFAVFRRTFGREPLPHEPLFFVRQDNRPIKATGEEMRRQLSEAAARTHTSLPSILEFLNLRESPPTTKIRTAHGMPIRGRGWDRVASTPASQGDRLALERVANPFGDRRATGNSPTSPRGRSH